MVSDGGILLSFLSYCNFGFTVSLVVDCLTQARLCPDWSQTPELKQLVYV